MKNYLEFEEALREQEIALLSATGDRVTQLQEKIQSIKKDIQKQLTPWQRVQLSRHPDRPYALDYIRAWGEFIELHGDRCFGDDKAIVAGLLNIQGRKVMVIGQQKGRNIKERQYRNFGMPHPEGYRKANRLMRLAEKFSLPVITLVDTPGAFPGLGAEERGQAQAIAQNLLDMSQLKTPIITVIIGEGASGGALGLAVADRVLMMENTWYSVISPESCSSILFRTWDKKEQAANILKLTAEDMLSNRLIDGIIPEPLAGIHHDPAVGIDKVKATVLTLLDELQELKPEELIQKRHNHLLARASAIKN